jgi:hypothetical protein
MITVERPFEAAMPAFEPFFLEHRLLRHPRSIC